MAHFTASDGTVLQYESIGDGPPLLLVPGGPRAARYLEDLGGLAATRRLIRFDARGTGASPRPADPGSYAYPSLAEDVDALRTHLGIDRADVLGHSAGSVVATAWAAAHRCAVGHLVLVSPSPQLYGQGGGDAGRILAARAAQPWYPAVAEAAGELLTLPPTAAPELVLDVLDRYTPAAYGRWDARQREHAATQRADFALEAWTGFWAGTDNAWLTSLRSVTAPVLVLTGDRDGLTGVEVGDVAAAGFPNAKHVTLPGAGHYPWVDEPAAFAAAVAQFLP
ncbi:alpha/beta fold hydrolase [Dactylosporangium sp. NPDC048998]|uniref:alpha/beta fold hydrolase n=1 Tax=Dactylosporangium sp. NPDC048998 TaxID=3363976 RepID=UPI00371D6A46